MIQVTQRAATTSSLVAHHDSPSRPYGRTSTATVRSCIFMVRYALQTGDDRNRRVCPASQYDIDFHTPILYKPLLLVDLRYSLHESSNHPFTIQNAPRNILLRHSRMMVWGLLILPHGPGSFANYGSSIPIQLPLAPKSSALTNFLVVSVTRPAVFTPCNRKLHLSRTRARCHVNCG